jgi:predicted AlkP superfamily pyrophosphatase or phosphodiesterase
MILRLSLRLILAQSLVLATIAASLGQGTPQTSAPQKRPRLVLLIAVDQFRYDYLERFGDLFAANGLRRLLRDGASWTQCHYDHMPTYTAPGHATMMTGAFPAATGIIGNEWLDRPSGKKVTSVSDESVKALGGSPSDTGSSPRRLIGSTVGDELRLNTNGRSKVVGISVKDRSAILPAGRNASAAYWFSTTSGKMISSTYYFNELPAWVIAFSNAKPADKFFGAKWDRLLPEAEYVKRAGPDAAPWENVGASSGDSNAFPRTITGGATAPGSVFYSALRYSPFVNDLLVSFAQQAIVNEQLGQDDDPDVLTISLSANDYVGHRFGPYSHETMDAILRTDRQIATLLDFVHLRVGLPNTLIAFVADHGVAPIPEQAAKLGLGGSRLKTVDVMATIRTAISAKYNPQGKSPDPSADYLLRYDDYGTKREWFLNGNIYFDYDALNRDGVSLEEISQVAATAALTVPGIARSFTRPQLMRRAVSITDPIERRVLNGFSPVRSGDVVIVAEPYNYVAETVNATHGSVYSYDTHVPLIIMGTGVIPGRYFEAATPADLAPTLSALLRMTPPPIAAGRLLVEAIRK